jgi:hypothetical protein
MCRTVINCATPHFMYFNGLGHEAHEAPHSALQLPAAAGWTMASGVASPLVVCASTTPLRMRF